ncbi:Flagellar biosynthesis protein FliR [Rhodovastum atsumiense]|uniref:Flagellar biosynthetic protein FliR n=1 Tax=Rhodovastum atsumiense TaxID=504468 RepID=A0A5M6ISE3_9PROT|nr:flagellar biosynthetic protein FliR [Rhodovastum atsumiense]KAA5611111.1 flagellar biosynthetic protein FliR [Rhodovastum atsumiense]CAH2599176.1 Flagellar biosynthesis protein FliR [Rhodovastum atsumiense]
METLLAELPGWAFVVVLLSSRIGAACIVLPGLGEAELPVMVRSGFAFALTLLLVPVLAPLVPAAPEMPWRVAAMVVAEIMTGLWLGWLARLVVQALPVAGQFAASMIGLANVLQPDPSLGPQSTALARLFSLAAPVLVLASGLYALPLSALAGSYRLVAPGALLPVADSAQDVVRAVGEAFALSLRLAAPFVAAGLVWQAALGLLARLVPNLQVFMAALPGQILAGLLLLALLTGPMLAAWDDQIRPMLALLPGL